MIKLKKLTPAIILLVFGGSLLVASVYHWWPWNVGVEQENSIQVFSSKVECEMATGKICTLTLCATYIGNNCKSLWTPTEKDRTYDSLENWQTYRNEELGFEFKYPSTWQQRPNPPEGYVAEFWMPDYREKDAAYWIKVQHYSGLFAIKWPRCELPDCVQRTVGAFYVEERGLLANARITIPVPEGGMVIISMTPVNADYQRKNVFEGVLSSFRFISKEIPTDWQTYRNEEYGFELKYPTEWEPLTQDYTACENKDCLYHGSYLPLTYGQDNSKFIPEHTFCFALTNRDEFSSCEMELYISKDVTKFSSDRIDFLGLPVTRSPAAPIGGILAKMYAKGQTITNVFIQKDGWIYLFTLPYATDKTREQFNKILSTFKFTE